MKLQAEELLLSSSLLESLIPGDSGIPRKISFLKEPSIILNLNILDHLIQYYKFKVRHLTLASFRNFECLASHAFGIQLLIF